MLANLNWFFHFVVCSWTLIVVCQGQTFSAPSELASRFNVTANSTCGDPVEIFCTGVNSCVDKCNSSAPLLAHPISYINDAYSLANPTYWKSKNMDRPVFIDIHFGAVFMLYSATITFQFKLPAAMYFSKSKDYGATYKRLGYYSTGCQKYYSMPVTTENNKNGLKAECFQQSLSEKLIEYNPMRDRNTALAVRNNHTVQIEFLMTDIRVVLDWYNSGELASEQSAFFAVQNLDVMAACFCNGQASGCNPQKLQECICTKNTAGNNCEKCLPLFNNRQYAPRQACEDCGCNNHSVSCEYSVAKSYGICQNCTDNTMGDKCEICRPKFYRNPSVLFNNTNTCLDCGCHLNGVQDTANKTHCHPVTGKCDCKLNLLGRACDTCKDTFWNASSVSLDGCQNCSCNLAGTVNASNVCDKTSGKCQCKPTVTGQACDKCKAGYYSLESNSTAGCRECGCNPAGSHNVSCNDMGACFCRQHFSGSKCETIESGFFVPSVGSMTFEAEKGTIAPVSQKKISHSMIADSAGTSRLFVGVVLKEGDNVTNPTQLTLTAKVPRTAQYDVALRYKTSYNWQQIRLTMTLRTLFTSFSCDGGATTVTSNNPTILLSNLTAAAEAAVFGSACLREGTYSVEVVLPPGSAGANASVAEVTMDSVVLYPSVTKFSEYDRASSTKKQNISHYHGIVPSYKLWSGQSAIGCQVLSGFYGYLYQKGQACDCNATGAINSAVCDECGGQCNCRPNVIGRQCEECRPDYYNYTSGLGCQDCACDMVGSNRSSCHASTGQCECKTAVIGRQCSLCQTNYFDFSSGAGCTDCGCNTVYSRDLQCHDVTGVCTCKPGVGGAKCTQCADTFNNLTTSGCTGCGCNVFGSTTVVCNKTSGQCPCRAQALGRVCDQCPSGYYGLGSGHPSGCLKCQCSGKSTNCSTASGYTKREVNSLLLTTSDNTDNDGWKGVDIAGINLNNLIWDFYKPLTGFIKAKSDAEFFYSSPAKYLTQGRYAYTESLVFYLMQTNASSPELSTKGDVIIKGKDFNQVLVHSLPSPPGQKFTKYEVKFLESYWKVGNTLGPVATSNQLVAVLSSLESLLIRGQWTKLRGPSYETGLRTISMTFSNKSDTSGSTTYNVETCQCPSQYVGQFCEKCAPGFTRETPNGGSYVSCLRCDCNGHSDSCDPESGVCIGCQNNTAGDHCEKCAISYYGNATQGTPSDCHECPCPGGPFTNNTYSRTCILDSDGQPTCTNCSTGHSGRRCEKCTDGYYGTPTDVNSGQCQKCNCNGNVDRGVTGNCNTTTGECVKCLYNTTGFNCQWCTPGYYGNALTKTCERCNCTQLGSRDNVCQRVTGQCNCRPRVIGLTCDRCEADAFNYTSGEGCTACGCHPQGSNKTQCDLITGKCDCNTNVKGNKCNECDPHFYNVGKGCIACNCFENYTQPNSTCDVETGQCACNISLGGGYYGGRTCDTCAKRTVGKPELCYACTDRCYDRWYGHIEIETQNVEVLNRNVTLMLASFGGLSVEAINNTLQELNRNLTSAEAVFRGAQYNTREYQTLIDGIRSSINNLQSRLNASRRALTETEQYLDSTAYGFNGTVQVSAQVYADWLSLEAMATGYRNRARTHNASGHAAYANIVNSYTTIQIANATAATAAKHIADAMTRLDGVARQRGDVETRLGPGFQSGLQQNNELLSQIQSLSDQISALATAAKDAGDNATTSVGQAENTIKTANETAYQKRAQAQQALQNATAAQTQATEAKTAAADAQKTAQEFKNNASGVLTQAQTALHNVTQGVKTIQSVTNMTRDSEAIAQSIRAKTMPVSLETIQNLANEIKSTPVNNTLINQTYESAANGLQVAREVEAVSQKAIDAAQKTLSEVQSIENNINTARTTRTETENLQKQTDAKVAVIKNITDSVQSKFSSALNIGQDTLTLINTTIQSVEESLTCYNESKQRAHNAAVTAERAYNLSKEARKVNESIAAVLPDASAQINGLYAVAKANYTEITTAHNESVQLLKDVQEAQSLLEDYTQQREEMNRLQSEVETLEGELDTLNTQLEDNLKRYESCGST